VTRGFPHAKERCERDIKVVQGVHRAKKMVQFDNLYCYYYIPAASLLTSRLWTLAGWRGVVALRRGSLLFRGGRAPAVTSFSPTPPLPSTTEWSPESYSLSCTRSAISRPPHTKASRSVRDRAAGDHLMWTPSEERKCPHEGSKCARKKEKWILWQLISIPTIGNSYFVHSMTRARTDTGGKMVLREGFWSFLGGIHLPPLRSPRRHHFSAQMNGPRCRIP